MMMAESVAFDNIQQLTGMAESLGAFVQQAAVAGTAAHEVEREVWKRILVIGRQATGHFFQLQGDGDLGETLEMSDGRELRRLDEPHRRTYRSKGRLRFRDMSTVRVKDNGSTSSPSTHGWSCPRASIRMCFRIGRGRFRWSTRSAVRPIRSRGCWSFRFRLTV